MQIKFDSAVIVLLSDSHNPNAPLVEWLRNKKIVNEFPQNLICTPGFSTIKFDKFFVLIDTTKLEVVTQNCDDKNILRTLPSVVKCYIENQPALPYKAMGFNFLFRALYPEKNKVPNINISISTVSNLSEIFPAHRLDYGGIIHATTNSYILNLLIDVKNEPFIVFSFNYHYNLSGQSIDKVLEYLNSFEQMVVFSEEIVQKIGGNNGS